MAGDRALLHEILADLASAAIERDDGEDVGHSTRGGIGIAIQEPGGSQAHTVLCVVTDEAHELSTEDLDDLQSVAYILAAATERQHADDALRASEARFRSAFDDAAIAMGIATLEGRLVRVNQPHCALLGYSEEELVGRPIREFIHPDELYSTDENRALLLSGERRSYRTERRYIRKDGSTVWGLVSLSLMRDADGKPSFVLAQVQDISDRKRAEEHLRRREQEFRALVENATDVIVRFDRELRHVYVNPAIEKIIGIPRASLIGLTHAELTTDNATAQLWESKLLQVLESRRETTFQFPLETTEGMRTYLARLTPEFDAIGEVESILSISRDISEHHEHSQRLQHQAVHDTLTGLPNRALLYDRLRQALALSRRQGQSVAVLFLDLDNFKLVNDTLGHAVGDELLQRVARRLERCVREEDTVARFGGDEFAILLPNVADTAGAVEVAERIIAWLKPDFDLGANDHRVTTSVGIALSRSTSDAPDDLLRWADIAMYRAKAAGKNQLQIFDAEMRAAARVRQEREHDLRAATERDEFVLHYLPSVDLMSGNVVGLEALARWSHPERGLIAPDQFIELAEETNLIIPFGEWSIDAACAQLRTMCASRSADGCYVALNLSAGQFRQGNLVEVVGGLLDSAGVNPQQLVLEVAESVIGEQTAAASATLRALHELGVRLCLDDFGTGCSSLAELRRLPIDMLKIDQRLIGGIDADAADRDVTRAAIAAGRALGMRIIAEGVERQTQVDLLRDLGCDEAQGYYFSRPLASDAIEAFLSRVRGKRPSAAGHAGNEWYWPGTR
jgi:diguanylate cyclase (GGDEF)-like protein/PAS domain S-box-containing protein